MNEKKEKEGTVHAPFPGEGTEESPYLISTAKDLEKLAEVMAGDYEAFGSSCYRLENNIKMKKGRNNHTPIGSVEQPFNGEFDGDGYIIEGLSIHKPKKEAQGLFAVIGEEGTVRGTGMKDNRICGQSDVGAVAGINYGMIEACFQTGEVYGLKNNTGTIAGRNSGTVSNCYSTGLAAGGYRTGDYIPEAGEDGKGRSAGRGGFREFIQTVAETIAETVAFVIEETKAGLETLYELVTTAFSPESSQLQTEESGETGPEVQTEGMSPEDSIADLETLTEEPGAEYDEESGKPAVGGLVGRNTGGVVENSYQAGRQAARNDDWSVGGACGVSHDGVLDNLYYIQRVAKSHEESQEENGVYAVSPERMTGEEAAERLGLEAEFWVGRATDENREGEQSGGPGAVKGTTGGPGETTAGDSEIMSDGIAAVEKGPGTEPGSPEAVVEETGTKSGSAEPEPEGPGIEPVSSELAQEDPGITPVLTEQAAGESDYPVRYRHYYPQLTVFAEKGQPHPYTLGMLEADGLRIDGLGQRAYVSSEEGWNWLFATEDYYHYTVILETDLNLSGFRKSIGTWEKPFTGILDGDGHVISGLRQPLFGIMGEGSAVYYLLLDQSKVTGTIRRGSHDTAVEAETCGMLAAYTEGTVIDSCGAVGVITLKRQKDGRPVYAGGLIGEAGAGTSIYESYAFVNILETLEENSSVTVGGLAGLMGRDAGADNCYATGRLDCSGLTGGFAGENRGEIRDSFVTTIIGNTARQAGAFVGKMDGAAAEQAPANQTEINQEAAGQVAANPKKEETYQEEGPAMTAMVSRVPVERILLKSSGSADLQSRKTEQVAEKPTEETSTAAARETEPSRTPDGTKTTTSGTEEGSGEKGTSGSGTNASDGVQPTSGSGANASGNESPTSGSGANASGNESPTSGSGENASDSEQPTSDSGANASDSEQPTSGSGESAAQPSESGTDTRPEEKGPGVTSTPSGAETQKPEQGTQSQEAQSDREQPSAKEEWIKQNYTITGCAYDSQMSGCADLYTEPLQTVDMTGADAVLPGGDWYMTEEAYPQLKCMALHTDETYILRSKASAIPLILPVGINLSDMPEEKEEDSEPDGDIKISGSVEVGIPTQIDGDPIQWTDPERMTVQEDGRAVLNLD